MPAEVKLVLNVHLTLPIGFTAKLTLLPLPIKKDIPVKVPIGIFMPSLVFLSSLFWAFITRLLLSTLISLPLQTIEEMVTEKSGQTGEKVELAYYSKIYDADVALNSIRCMDNRYDITHNLENIVYNELIYMGYNVNVFNNNGKEIDFLAIKDNKKYYIQVAYSIAEEKTYNREFSAFENIDNLSQKIIITNDDIDYSTIVIKHIKLKDFLLLESL